MFEDVWNVARLSPQVWARKQHLRPAEARLQYLRVLRAHTEAWVSTGDDTDREAVPRLLRLSHEGAFAGMAAALAKGIPVPAQTLPDWEEGWNWLQERLSAWPRWLLWQAYTSTLPSVAEMAAGELNRRQAEEPSALWAWVCAPGRLVPEGAAVEWSTLPATVQLALWGKVRAGHGGAHDPRPVGSGPWLLLLSRPEPPGSPHWKPLTNAGTDVMRLFFTVADPDVRDAAFHALLRTARGRRALPSLFQAHALPVAEEERERWTQALLETWAKTTATADPLATAAVALAPATFAWPAWVRAHLEADVAHRGTKSPFHKDIGRWHELGLDAFPHSVRTLWARQAKTDAEVRHALTWRWIEWWYRQPREAAAEAPPAPGATSFSGHEAVWLRALLAAGEGPISEATLFTPEPLYGLAVLSEHITRHGTLPYDRLPSWEALFAGVAEGQQQLLKLEAALTVAALRRDPAIEQALPPDFFRRVRDYLGHSLLQRRMRFSSAWDAAADALETLTTQIPVLQDLVSEILGLRRRLTSSVDTPLPANQIGENPSVVSEIISLSVALDTAVQREEHIVAECLSPTEKCFDLGLNAYLEALEQALQPLGVRWIARTADPTPYDPVRYRLIIQQTPDVPEWIRPRSPGLIRNGQVLQPAWAEPFSPNEEVAP